MTWAALVGCLLTWPTAARQQAGVVVTGVVVDAETGLPVSAANIELNGSPSGVSDHNGRFRIEIALEPGIAYQLSASRIGYQQSQQAFEVQAATQTVDIIVHLLPVPVDLGAIEVKGDAERASLANLTGFNRRRENLRGNFFTREDIARLGAQRVTEVVRRVPGSIVYSPENVYADPITNPAEANGAIEQRTIITFQRSGYSRGAPCEALVFVNDVQVSDPNIDWLVEPTSIVGMEVYTGASMVPAEYNKRGADCGVVVIWTDAPTRGPVRGLVNSLEVGGVATARMRHGGFEGERFGVQLRVPIMGPVELHPSFHLIVGNSVEGDAGWQVMANLKAWPLGRRTPFYLGTGVTGVNNTNSIFDTRQKQGAMRFMPVALSGVSLPVGPVRPFLEFQMLDPFGDRQSYFATGLTVVQR